MTVEVILPKWGLTMEEGTLVNWLVEEGASIREGEPLAEVATDKIVNQLSAPVSGVVSKILVPAGTEEIAVGTVICLIEEK
jgi:pyruvate/2-oxoglutarate dehydrogenase complex dihydrolipoamide acyltransferase (E2) component